MNRLSVLMAVCIAACSSQPRGPAPPVRELVAGLQIADAQYRKGDLEAAEQTYLAVLSIDPQSIEARVRLGNIAHQRGDYRRAEEYFNQVLAGDPRNQTAAYNLAVLHVEQAHKLFDRYLKVSSTQAAERPAVFELQRALQQFRER